jgi:D-psicose/D-tagatose/L-ribulose 3-epimerase
MLAGNKDAGLALDVAAAHGKKLLHDSLAVTGALGGTHFTSALYSALGKYDRPLSEAGRANVVSALHRLTQETQDRGMTLGLEICSPYETNVINTAHDAPRLADDISEDNVLIHLDTCRMNIEEDDLVRPVREVRARLGYVHVGENHWGHLGSWHPDFTSFLHAQADIGYRGPITFESFSSAVVMRGLSNDLAIWRDLWSDGEDLARQARPFIAGQLHASGAAADDRSAGFAGGDRSAEFMSGPSDRPVSGPSDRPVSGPSDRPVSGPSDRPVGGSSGGHSASGQAR